MGKKICKPLFRDLHFLCELFRSRIIKFYVIWVKIGVFRLFAHSFQPRPPFKPIFSFSMKLHNRLIVFNSSFSKLYRDVGIFSGQSNICQPFRQRCVLGHRLYKGSTFLFKATHHTSVSRERARCDRLYIPTCLLMYGNPAAESAAVV